MKKFYPLLFWLLAITASISSCKIDDPVLPDGLVTKDGTSVTGGGGSAGGSKTLKVQFNNGTEKTYAQVTFVTVFGLNSISGINNGADMFSLSYIGDGLGAFTTQTCTFGNYSNDLDKAGKVTIIQNSMDTALPPKGIIKGSFEISVVDLSDKPAGKVQGSFSITQ